MKTNTEKLDEIRALIGKLDVMNFADAEQSLGMAWDAIRLIRELIDGDMPEEDRELLARIMA